MEPKPTAQTAAAATKTKSTAARWWTAQMTPTSSTPMVLSPRYCWKNADYWVESVEIYLFVKVCIKLPLGFRRERIHPRPG